jgi:hypothetical protein
MLEYADHGGDPAAGDGLYSFPRAQVVRPVLNRLLRQPLTIPALLCQPRAVMHHAPAGRHFKLQVLRVSNRARTLHRRTILLTNSVSMQL